MNDWYSDHRLIHYTSSHEVVGSILDLGFLLVPNKRELIRRFLPDDDFTRREPQEFGMVSFTELRLADSRRHREQFGQFGICVSWEWALRNGAQRVLYVGDDGGGVFQALKWLFRLGRQEVERLRREPGNFMLENKAMAGGLGAEVYHAVLTLYEYMESERNSSQVEWRIVQQIPTYHSSQSRAGLVKEVLEAAKSWKQYAVQIEPRDIDMFVCDSADIAKLRAILPKKFKEVPIHGYTRARSLNTIFARVAEAFRGVLRRRESLVYVPYSAPKGSVLLPKADDGRAVLLPWVANLWGIALHPSAIENDVWVSSQYQDDKGELFEMRLPVSEAKKLMMNLIQIDRMGWRAPYQ